MTPIRHNPWLHRCAILVAGATFLLITAGALVTSNDAGLSVPDWPTSFGSFRMPRMVGGVLYEHGHRMMAATVGFLTLLLAIWLWRAEPRRWVRRLGGYAVLTILAQAILGGITVRFYLPAIISVSHATLAQIFFCLTVSLALFTRPDWRWDEPRNEDPLTPSLRQLTTTTSISVLLQLISGAAFRHSGFGIAPHLAGALVVTILIGWVVLRILWRYPSVPALRWAALGLAGTLMLQLFLGIGSFFLKMTSLSAPQPLPAVVAMTTAHVAVGALLMATSLVLTLETYRRVAPPEIHASETPRRASAPHGVRT